MVKLAEQNAAEDQRRKALIEARNTADHVIYQVEKNLSSLNGQAPDHLRQSLEAKIISLRESVVGEDTDRIRQLTEEVQQASLAISQTANQNGTPQNGSTPHENRTTETINDDEDVFEGEFEEA